MKPDEQEFCLNSKKWVLFMRATPKMCPYSLYKCQSCSYCEKRPETEYFKNKLKYVKSLGVI